MSIDSWEWVPGVSVGPFQFGSDAKAVIDRFSLRKLDRVSSVVYWENYEIPGHESDITVEDNKISSVNCWDSLKYKEFDILKLHLDEVRVILGPEEGAEIAYEGTKAVSYYSLGLYLFVDMENERIKSATCEVADLETLSQSGLEVTQ